MDPKEEERLRARFTAMMDQIRSHMLQSVETVKQALEPLDPAKGERFDPEAAQIALDINAFLRTCPWRQKARFFLLCCGLIAEHEGLLGGVDTNITILGMVGAIGATFTNGNNLIRAFLEEAKRVEDSPEGGEENP